MKILDNCGLTEPRFPRWFEFQLQVHDVRLVKQPSLGLRAIFQLSFYLMTESVILDVRQAKV